MTNNVVVVTGDEWHGIYVNGELFYENHRLSSRDFVDLMNKHKNIYSAVIRSLNKDGLVWLEDNGHLPERLWHLPDGLFERWN